MEHLMAIAKGKGMASVWGLVLAENIHMLALARKFGSTAGFAGGNQYKLKIDLKNHPSSLSAPEKPSLPEAVNSEK